MSRSGLSARLRTRASTRWPRGAAPRSTRCAAPPSTACCWGGRSSSAAPALGFDPWTARCRGGRHKAGCWCRRFRRRPLPGLPSLPEACSLAVGWCRRRRRLPPRPCSSASDRSCSSPRLSKRHCFAGYLLGLWRHAAGPGPAVASTSLVFALAHSGNPAAAPLTFLNTTLAGVVLAVLALRSASLWPPRPVPLRLELRPGARSGTADQRSGLGERCGPLRPGSGSARRRRVRLRRRRGGDLRSSRLVGGRCSPADAGAERAGPPRASARGRGRCERRRRLDERPRPGSDGVVHLIEGFGIRTSPSA